DDRRAVMPEAGDRQLADRAGAVAQGGGGVLGDLDPGMGGTGPIKADRGPGLPGQGLQCGEELCRAHSKRDEADAPGMKLGQCGMRGELGVETTREGSAPHTLFQWSQKAITSLPWLALSRSALAWTRAAEVAYWPKRLIPGGVRWARRGR